MEQARGGQSPATAAYFIARAASNLIAHTVPRISGRPRRGWELRARRPIGERLQHTILL